MSALLALVLLVSSIAAMLSAAKYVDSSRDTLVFAWNTLLECLGLAALFYAANIAIVTTIVVIPRVLGMGFVSAYVTSDVVWPVFSVLQAVSFRWWLVSKSLRKR